MSAPDFPPTVPVRWLTDAVASVFGALGYSEQAAGLVAGSLVDADMRGIPSHGVMLLPMYVDRIRAGSVSRAERAEVVRDYGRHRGARRRPRARVSSPVTRRCGWRWRRRRRTASAWSRSAGRSTSAGRSATWTCAANSGCIGIAAANTRPLMPAPGGASAVVGNNPLAVGVPRAGGEPVILDVALSEAALGKIRLAAGEGREIPASWATDAQGRPTTDPAAAIKGLLLPSGAHKGYGLALMIDVLTGVLSGGAYGQGVQGLYADVSVPNDCAHFFLALDAEAFAEDAEEFARRVDDLAGQVLGSALAPGTERVHLPGDIEAGRYDRAPRDGVALQPSVFAGLVEVAAGLGVPLQYRPASADPGRVRGRSKEDMQASFDATGEVLVVTGGANGIGAALAHAYADAGGHGRRVRRRPRASRTPPGGCTSTGWTCPTGTRCTPRSPGCSPSTAGSTPWWPARRCSRGATWSTWTPSSGAARWR